MEFVVLVSFRIWFYQPRLRWGLLAKMCYSASRDQLRQRIASTVAHNHYNMANSTQGNSCNAHNSCNNKNKCNNQTQIYYPIIPANHEKLICTKTKKVTKTKTRTTASLPFKWCHHTNESIQAVPHVGRIWNLSKWRHLSSYIFIYPGICLPSYLVQLNYLYMDRWIDPAIYILYIIQHYNYIDIQLYWLPHHQGLVSLFIIQGLAN